MYNCTINYKESRQTWDDFVATSPQRSIFVSSNFLDSLQRNYDLVTCYEKGRIVAGTVIIYGEDGEPIEGTFPFTLYQGLLLADDTAKNIHSQITHEFRVTEYFVGQIISRYKSGSFCHSWRLRDIRPFLWHNYSEPEKGQFKTEPGYSGVLDLRCYENFEAYLLSVRSVRRQEYKKSSQILRFGYCEDVSVLDELHAKTFERQNLKREDYASALLQSISSQAIAGGYGKMGVAYLNDVPISAVLFLYDDRTAYYLFGANDPEHRSTNAGSFVLFKMIQDAMSEGMQEVDFVGVNSPNRGDFKISFNAELKPYFTTSMHSNS